MSLFSKTLYKLSSVQFSHSVMSNSLWPHGLQPTRLFYPWDFPGKSTGVGRHCLLPIKANLLINSSRWIYSSSYISNDLKVYPALPSADHPLWHPPWIPQRSLSVPADISTIGGVFLSVGTSLYLQHSSAPFFWFLLSFFFLSLYPVARAFFLSF